MTSPAHAVPYRISAAGLAALATDPATDNPQTTVVGSVYARTLVITAQGHAALACPASTDIPVEPRRDRIGAGR